MDIPQLEPESKPEVFKVKVEGVAYPWICRIGFAVKPFAHWDQAIDCALSHCPKPRPIAVKLGDRVMLQVKSFPRPLYGVVTWLGTDGRLTVVSDEGYSMFTIVDRVVIV